MDATIDVDRVAGLFDGGRHGNGSVRLRRSRQALQWFDQPLHLSREGVYTIAFFTFWFVLMASSALTTLLSLSPFELNRCPVPKGARPADCAKYVS